MLNHTGGSVQELGTGEPPGQCGETEEEAEAREL